MAWCEQCTVYNIIKTYKHVVLLFDEQILQIYKKMHYNIHYIQNINNRYNSIHVNKLLVFSIISYIYLPRFLIRFAIRLRIRLS